MAQKNINIGTPNGQDGDFVRDAFSKAEDNFTELFFSKNAVVDVSANWLGGLSFYVVASLFPVGQVWTSAVASTITLDAADATLSRIDLIVANKNKTVGSITGIPSLNPAEPNYDSETQYPIKFVLVKAGETDPSGFEDKLVFDEDSGEPSEWTFIPEANIVASTSEAYVNSKSIEGTNTLLNRATLTTNTPVETSTLNTFSFWVKLKESYDTSFSGEKITVYFSKSTPNIGVGPSRTPVPINTVIVRNNLYGFDSSNLNWQKITIGMKEAGLTLSSIDIIEISPYKSTSGTLGWFLDELKLQVSEEVGSIPNDFPTKTSYFDNDGEGKVNSSGEPLKYITEADIPVKATDLLDVSATWTGNLNFDVTAAKFPLLGVWKSAIAAEVVLTPAHSSLDRIDLIVAKDDNTVGKVTGVPSASPAEPDYNFSTEFPLKFVLVKANTSIPDGFTDKTIFNENLGEPSEWEFVPNSQVDVSTGEAYVGTISAKATSPVYAKFEVKSVTPILTDTINTLSFQFKIAQDYLKESVFVTLFDGETPYRMFFKDGQFGFNSSFLDWQKITIDISQRDSIIPKIDKLEINPAIRGDYVSWFIDDVKFQTATKAGTTPVPTDYPRYTSNFINDGDGSGSRYARIDELGGGSVGVENSYSTMTALYSDQSNQTSSNFQFVQNAILFPGVSGGSAYFEYLGTTVGNESDYRLMSSSESGGSGGPLEWATYTGTRAGGDLVVKIGDYDGSAGNGEKFLEIDINEETIKAPLYYNFQLIDADSIIWENDPEIDPTSDYSSRAHHNLQFVDGDATRSTHASIVGIPYAEYGQFGIMFTNRDLNTTERNFKILINQEDTTLTEDSEINFPGNKSGTVALLSDIGGGTGVGGTELVDEGQGIGLIRSGRASVNYGSIGDSAVDFGHSNGTSSTVGATGDLSVVGGGNNNTASGPSATVAGGYSNTASSYYATIGGGVNNNAGGGGYGPTVAGGNNNTASGYYPTVGGGSSNTASADYATVSGGYTNNATGQKSVISGGSENVASGDFSIISGGRLNTASNYRAVVAGGQENTSSGPYSMTWGKGNTAQNDNETVFGKYATLGTNRKLAIGDGADNGNRSNLFEVYNSGGVVLKPSSEPSETIEAMLYYDDTLKALKYYNGSAWVQIAVTV